MKQMRPLGDVMVSVKTSSGGMGQALSLDGGGLCVYPSRARHWLRRRRYRVACCMGGAYGSRTYRGIERRVVARTLDRLPGPGPAATGRNVLDERSPVSSCSTKATQKVGIMSENYEDRRRRRQVWEISLRQAQARSSMDPTSSMSVPSQSTSVKPDVARDLWS